MGPQEETQFGPKALQDFCKNIFEKFPKWNALRWK